LGLGTAPWGRKGARNGLAKNGGAGEGTWFVEEVEASSEVEELPMGGSISF